MAGICAHELDVVKRNKGDKQVHTPDYMNSLVTGAMTQLFNWIKDVMNRNQIGNQLECTDITGNNGQPGE
jgi:hypothetical protein